MKTLIAGLVTLAQLGCVTFSGTVDLAYVPKYSDDVTYKNGYKSKFGVRAERSIMKHEVGLEGSVDTFGVRNGSNSLSNGYWRPLRSTYIYEVNVRRKNFEVYVNHLCSHPTNGKGFAIEYEGKKYNMLHDNKTEIGLRIKFGGK